MGLPEINRAGIKKLESDVNVLEQDVSQLKGDVSNIDPVVRDDSFPNVVPGTPTGVVANALFRTIQVVWDYVGASYIKQYEVYASKEPGFHPLDSHLVWKGKSGGYNHKASLGETWYFKVRARNYHDSVSEFSLEASASTVNISGLEIDEQYQIDTIEYANQYTQERETEIMKVVADKLDAQVFHDNIILKADAETVNQRFDSLLGDLNDKADSSTVTALQGTVSTMQTELADKVDAEWVNGELVSKANVSDVYTKIEVDNAVDSRVLATTYATDQQGIVTRFESAESRISQTETDITSLVTKDTYNALEGRMDSAETNISQNATAITSKASQDSVDTLSGRVESAETTITQHADSIASKAENTMLDPTTGSVKTLASIITQQAGMIESKVESTTYTTDMQGVNTNISNHESRITQNETDIEARVTKTTHDALAGRVTTAEGNISANTNAIALRVTQETYDKDINDEANGLIARMNSAEGEISVLNDEILLRVTETELDTRMGDVVDRLDTNEATLTAHATQISQRVTSSTFNALEGRVDTAEGNISTQAGQIALKASQSSLDATNERLSSAEATLEVLPGQISSKVEKDGVLSAIYQSAESVKIQASKVAIDGDLVVENGLVRLKDAIIDRAHIKEGIITRDLFADNAVVGEINAGTALVDFAKIGNIAVTNDMIAGRIGADKLIIGEGVSFDEGYDPTKLIPQRNLVKNSDFTFGLTNWRNWGNVAGSRELRPLSNHPGFSRGFWYSADASGEFGYAQDNVTIVPGQVYTLSAWFYAGANSTGKIKVQNGNSIDRWEYTDYDVAPFIGKWGRIKHTFTAKSNSTGVYVGQADSPDGGHNTCWVTGVKLELGDTWSDWSPAPEDNPAIDWVYGDTTEIDGGKIRANTVNANVLQANSVIATNIKFRGTLEGATGTFSGSVATPMLTVGTGNISSYREFGLRLVSAQWQTNGSYTKNGNVMFNTLNSGLEIYKETSSGASSRLDYFDVNASISTFGGELRAGNVSMNGYNSLVGDNTLYIEGKDGVNMFDRVSMADLKINRDSRSGFLLSLATYGRTYTYGTNMYVTANGVFGRDTSSRRFKIDEKVVSYEKALSLLKLEPKTWYDKSTYEQYSDALTRETNGEEVNWEEEDIPRVLSRTPGLIAEDVEDAGLTEYVRYDDDKQVTGLNDRLWTLLIPIVRKQEERISKLEQMLGL